MCRKCLDMWRRQRWALFGEMMERADNGRTGRGVEAGAGRTGQGRAAGIGAGSVVVGAGLKTTKD